MGRKGRWTRRSPPWRTRIRSSRRRRKDGPLHRHAAIGQAEAAWHLLHARRTDGIHPQYTVEELIAERFAAAAVEFGVPAKEARSRQGPRYAAYWRRCLAILRNLKIVDPACGGGAFLFQAYDVLESRYREVIGRLQQLAAADAEKLAENVPAFILQENLYGVDLFRPAVEIAQLALWMRSASPGQLLARLSENIVHGNSLVHDPEIDPDGFDWRTVPRRLQLNREKKKKKKKPRSRIRLRDRQPALGADEVAGTRILLLPPWKSPPPRMRPSGGSLSPSWRPAIRRCTNAIKALHAAESLLTYCRASGQYPLTGKGDINAYAVFAELACRLVAPHGRVGLLVPSGIAWDMTTKDFFPALAGSNG